MRVHPNAVRALSFSTMMALCAASAPVRSADEMTDEERKTPSPEPAPSYPTIRPTNLPGETNRQYAARMRATNTSEQST